VAICSTGNRGWPRYGVNSIPELELMVNSNFVIDYFKKIGIDKFGIEVSYKKFNPQSNLPFHFLIKKYFFCDNPTWNINY